MTPIAPAPAPPRRPPRSLARRAFELVSSPKLAIALLVGVLACCVAGVSIVKGERAWELIFNTLWFNGLLVLLAVASGLTFLGRYWGRKLTIISGGMIIFHVCFLVMLGGVVSNSLFHFKGVLRLTEGETLPNGDPASYDTIEAGRLFDFSRLHGETTLLKMHRDYKVGGLDKRAAYEIAVGEGADKTTGIIYVTQNLDRDGVRYLVSKEGYSLGVVLHELDGTELYAAMVPLQSLPQEGGTFLYTSGTSKAPGAFPFPSPPEAPVLELQVAYRPDPKQDRQGEVEFQAWPWVDPAARHGTPTAQEPEGRAGRVPVGGTFDAGTHQLEATEVRYWVGMTVRRDPGLWVILGSLWAGLGGMTLTFVGRILQDVKKARREAALRAAGTTTPSPEGTAT